MKIEYQKLVNYNFFFNSYKKFNYQSLFNCNVIWLFNDICIQIADY